MLRCFFRAIGGRDSLKEEGASTLFWMAIPFTLWEVPLPVSVSSMQSMLSYARVVKMKGVIVVGSVT
jgi:hypothetical protein